MENSSKMWQVSEVGKKKKKKKLKVVKNTFEGFLEKFSDMFPNEMLYLT